MSLTSITTLVVILSMINIHCFKIFHLMEAPTNTFLCGCQYLVRRVSCWSDDSAFLLKILHTRQICNGPCVSVPSSTQSSTFLKRTASERHETIDGGKLASLCLIQWRFSCANYLCVLSWLDKMSGFFFFFFSPITHSQNVDKLNLNRAVTGRSRSTVTARDSLFCLSKKISQK